jgi:rhamnulokinase
MTLAANYLAFDLGAESGRAVVGQFDGTRLHLEELHRFDNGPVHVLDSLYWDILLLWREVKASLGFAADTYGESLSSVGVDTWGVDFGLLGADDALLGNPYHYRDSRTDGMMDVAFARVPRTEIFQRTGIQFMQLNTLFQLLAMSQQHSPSLEVAKTLLTMPDIFNFWLTGRKASEFTIATTTQCYDPRSREWAFELLQQLDIPGHIFVDIVPPGTVLGKLRQAVAEETGCPSIPVVAPAAHDTGSAVAAVPAVDEDYIYLSSGTWSLMGIETQAPIITDRSLEFNLTNEGGVSQTFRVLKNIMGLWLVQESRREWSRSGESHSYDELTRMASEVPAFGPYVVPGDSRFLAPGDMPRRIQSFCQETGQRVPQTKGEIVRCALESLALEYRWVAQRLDQLADRHLPTIHIIGGGSRNQLLNQLTADATGRTVIAGPVEATAIGNIVVQAIALGHLASLAEGRALVRRSFTLKTFEPQTNSAWDEAYAKYQQTRASLHIV